MFFDNKVISKMFLIRSEIVVQAEDFSAPTDGFIDRSCNFTFTDVSFKNAYEHSTIFRVQQ